MKTLLKGCIASLLVALASPSLAEDYQHTGEKYPPVLFVTNIENQSFKEKLASYDAFQKIDAESVGLPIGVRVLKGRRTKADGTQFSTLMLSATTLGLIPVVSNTEFKVRYDVFVLGRSIAEFNYQTDSTEANSLWAGPPGSGPNKPSEDLFMEYTLSQFLKELKDHKEVQEIFAEYHEYFPVKN